MKKLSRLELLHLFSEPSPPLMEYVVPFINKPLGDCIGNELLSVGEALKALGNLLDALRTREVNQAQFTERFAAIISSQDCRCSQSDLRFIAKHCELEAAQDFRNAHTMLMGLLALGKISQNEFNEKMAKFGQRAIAA